MQDRGYVQDVGGQPNESGKNSLYPVGMSSCSSGFCPELKGKASLLGKVRSG
jgi:hypothetical protein